MHIGTRRSWHAAQVASQKPVLRALGNHRMQTPVGDAGELDVAELQSVRLFQDNTPSVVNISNISAIPHILHHMPLVRK